MFTVSKFYAPGFEDVTLSSQEQSALQQSAETLRAARP
jgi:hypothetical protein